MAKGASATQLLLFALVVADAFYENLFKKTDFTAVDTSGPDISQAARALHYAVAKLRAEGVPFTRWVPFIHLGR